jgi:hypothetical protein
MALRESFLALICLIGVASTYTAADDTPFALGELDTVTPAGGGFSKSGLAVDGWRVSGQIALTFFPLHNEFDPNFGVPFKESDAARYSVATDVTIKRADTPLFFRLYDSLALGRTFPQLDYNYDPTPILLETQPTLGWEWNRNLDARVTFDQTIDLGHFASHNQVTPWLALSARVKTDDPVNLFNALQFSGYGEFSLFVPGLEYPATPGASPQNPPDLGFSPNQIINARYGLTLDASVRPTAKYFDRFFHLRRTGVFLRGFHGLGSRFVRGFAAERAIKGGDRVSHRTRSGRADHTVAIHPHERRATGIGARIVPRDFADVRILSRRPRGLLHHERTGDLVVERLLLLGPQWHEPADQECEVRNIFGKCASSGAGERKASAFPIGHNDTHRQFAERGL